MRVGQLSDHRLLSWQCWQLLEQGTDRWSYAFLVESEYICLRLLRLRRKSRETQREQSLRRFPGYSCFFSDELYIQVQGAIDYVTSRSDLRGDVILFGRSLGGAVVIELATRPENEHIKACIVENTFTSVPLIGMSVFPFLTPVIKLLPMFAVKVRRD